MELVNSLSYIRIMGPERIELLTDRDRECLRLLRGPDRDRTSKEIARILGVSHHSVDKRMKNILKLLGVSTRFEAASVLSSYEGAPSQTGYQGLVPQSPEVAEPPKSEDQSTSTQGGWPTSRTLPVLRHGRRRNHLSPVERLGWIAILSFIILLAVANFFNALGLVHDLTNGLVS